MTEAQIVIAGCGPGSPGFLTREATEAVAGAEVLVGASHLLALFPEADAERVRVGADIPSLLDLIDTRKEKRIVVLVSGDTGISSLARPVVERFGRERCRLIPGISSVQVAFARLGLEWSDARILSAHGRTPGLDAKDLAGWRKIAVLAGDPRGSAWAADLLDSLGPDFTAFACEDLTLPGERVRTVEAAALRGGAFSSRTIILLLHKGVLI